MKRYETATFQRPPSWIEFTTDPNIWPSASYGSCRRKRTIRFLVSGHSCSVTAQIHTSTRIRARGYTTPTTHTCWKRRSTHLLETSFKTLCKVQGSPCDDCANCELNWPRIFHGQGPKLDWNPDEDQVSATSSPYDMAISSPHILLNGSIHLLSRISFPIDISK